MGILLGLGDAQLPKALLRNPLADRVGHVLLVEEDVQARELGVVGGHAAVVERHGVHAGLGHILLREDDRQLLGAVVAVVEEDNQVVRTDQTYGLARSIDMDDRLDELVRHVGIIGLLHGGDHVRVVLADTLDQRVVGHLHTLPALVSVHRIVTADHRGDLAARLGEVLFELGDEACRCAGRYRGRP